MASVGPFEDSPYGAQAPFFHVPQIIRHGLAEILRDNQMGTQGR
jgi:hypothetical protein